METLRYCSSPCQKMLGPSSPAQVASVPMHKPWKHVSCSQGAVHKQQECTVALPYRPHPKKPRNVHFMVAWEESRAGPKSPGCEKDQETPYEHCDQQTIRHTDRWDNFFLLQHPDADAISFSALKMNGLPFV